MKRELINADKPHLWKADIAASVDQFNQWFMRFAPEAFRSTRVKTTEHVKSALLATDDLRELTPERLRANPGGVADPSHVYRTAPGRGPTDRAVERQQVIDRSNGGRSTCSPDEG